MSTATQFIRHVEEINGRVLVHCIAGVSRSVTVVIMYLIMQHRLPLLHAFNYVKSCRYVRTYVTMRSLILYICVCVQGTLYLSSVPSKLSWIEVGVRCVLEPS
jgi:protein-tyrosine phosphatase